MATDSVSDSDPFADPRGIAEDERGFVAESTLHVGRNASLTLGTDALIVLDEGLRQEPRLNCCGLLPTRSTTTRSIPFYSILWASLTKVDLTIHYAKPTSKSSVRVAYVNYTLDLSSTAVITAASSWTARLLDRAYGPSQRKKRIKVLINPFGGAGKAGKLFNTQIEPMFAAARCEVDVERTTHSGHAVEIAESLDINEYDVVAAASGDGVVYEIFNGLSKKTNAVEALGKIAVVQLPCGTGNAMSWNLNGTDDPSMAALCIVKGLRTPLDLASVTQGDRRTISFLSQSVGIVAESDLGTDNIRWMGDARFTYGFLVRLLGKTVYPCDIAVKVEIEDKTDIKRHYAREVVRRRRRLPDPISSQTSEASTPGLPALCYGTVMDPIPSDWTPLSFYPNLGNFYAGNMSYMAEDAPFFPSSIPSDGMMDLVTIPGDIPKLKGMSLLFQVPKGTFFDDPTVQIRKVVAYRCVPRFGKWAADPNAASKQQSRLGKVLNKVSTSGGRANDDRDGGYISVDGEKVSFEPFQVEVHKALGTVLSRNGLLYESPGPSGWEAFLDETTSGEGVGGEQARAS